MRGCGRTNDAYRRSAEGDRYVVWAAKQRRHGGTAGIRPCAPGPLQGAPSLRVARFIPTVAIGQDHARGPAVQLIRCRRSVVFGRLLSPLALTSVLAIGLSGCASSPPPYQWTTDHAALRVL